MKVKTPKLNVTILSCTNIQNMIFSLYENLRKLPAYTVILLVWKVCKQFYRTRGAFILKPNILIYFC